MTNATATATTHKKTSSLNYYYLYIGLLVVVFVSSSASIRCVNAETVSISNAKKNDGWSANGGLRQAGIVTANVIKTAIFQEDNKFEGSIRYGSNEIDEIQVKPAATIVDASTTLYSSSSSSLKEEEKEGEEICYVSFQTEDRHADDHCEYERKIIKASKTDQDSSHTHNILIANNECHYDSHTGYWYQAACVMLDEWDVESITFQLVKSFCGGVGCTDCYDNNDELPNRLGTPSGRPVFHSWDDEKVTAMCPIPTTEEAGEELVIEFSGNCLAAICQ